MIHGTEHPLAGKTAVLALKSESESLETGDLFRIEDWWDRVSEGKPWGEMQGNPACIKYAIRIGFADPENRVPPDDEVVYGKVHGAGHLVHVSELGEVSSGSER